MAVKILALDTATESCSAALLYDNQIVEQYQLAPRQHTHLILPMMQTLLDTAGLSLAQLDAVAFGRGPGSFTGVRIATSVVQAIAFAHDLPVVLISTLQALAQGAYRNLQKKNIIAALDARMNEIYWSAYQVGEGAVMLPITPENVCAPTEIKLNSHLDFVGVGSGWDSYHQIMTSQVKIMEWIPQCYPHAFDIAALAEIDFKNGNAVSAEQALPVYLRDKVTNL